MDRALRSRHLRLARLAAKNAVMHSTTATISGWGRVNPVTATVATPSSTRELEAVDLPATTIPRGLGRSYGDAAQLSGGTVVETTNCTTVNRLGHEAGIVRAGAGVTIGELIDRFAPKGWFVPVSPGTRQVTIGGAIAADIHGKNHHLHGSFGSHVRAMRLRVADGSVVETSPTVETDLFWATIGGMGLTGIVIDADIALQAIPSTSVRVETERFATLPALTAHMRATDHLHEFSVAWVDLLSGGKSVLTQGSFQAGDDHVEASGLFQQPPNPRFALPRLTHPRAVRTPLMRVFNSAYYRLAPRETTVTNESITRFFHPLDALTNWNRLYGRTGFFQWQFVVPDDAEDVMLSIGRQLQSEPAYLTVLKRFGAGNKAPLSFPIAGWTLAIDMPATNDMRVLLDRLDQQVLDAGGRIYLAKDARMGRGAFEQMYPRLDQWKAVRRAVDPSGRFSSDLSLRLGL